MPACVGASQVPINEPLWFIWELCAKRSGVDFGGAIQLGWCIGSKDGVGRNRCHENIVPGDA